MIENGLYVDKEVKRHSSYIRVQLLATNTPIVGASAKRVRITFISDSAVDSFLDTDTGAFNGFHAINLNQRSGIITFDVVDYGSMVQAPWLGTSTGGAAFITCIETVES